VKSEIPLTPGDFHSRGGAAFWGPSVFFDIVVFAMTVYKSYVTIKHNTRSFGILRVLLRDGQSFECVSSLHSDYCISSRVAIFRVSDFTKGVNIQI